MPGPWEKYQPSKPETSDGPWRQYQTANEETQGGLLNRAASGALNLVGEGLDTLDRYTAAPVRRKLGELGGVKGTGEEAPTPKQLAMGLLGSSDKPEDSLSSAVPGMFSDTGDEWLKFKKGGFLDVTPADVSGAAMGVVTDPLSILPVGKAVQAVSRGTTQAVKGATKALEPVVEGAKNIAKGTVATVGNALSGVSKGDIRTYIDNLKEVNKMARKYGDNLAVAADETRESFMRDITAKRQELNAQITNALKAASPKRNVVIKEIKDELVAARKRLNATFDADEIAQIDELLAAVNKENRAGKATIGGLFELKEFLQDRAKSAYQKSGQIFQPGKKSQQAAKRAAAKARDLLSRVGPKDITEANTQLSQLHRIEENINRNVLAPGKSEAALIGAGAAPGSRQAANLRRLDKVVGKDFTGRAKKLSAYSRFGKPDLLPVDTTGKSFSRIAVGQALGLLSGIPGGQALAAVFTSPATLKAAINAGDISVEVLKKLAGGAGDLSDATLGRIVQAVNAPGGDKLLQRAYIGSQAVNRREEPRGLLK